MKGGEGIIRNLWACRGSRRKEGRFAGIGQSYQPRIGNQFQPQPDPHAHAREAFIGTARRLIRRRFERRVPSAAIAALRQGDSLANFRQIGQDQIPIFIENLSANGQFQRHVSPRKTSAIAASAGAT